MILLLIWCLQMETRLSLQRKRGSGAGGGEEDGGVGQNSGLPQEAMEYEEEEGQVPPSLTGDEIVQEFMMIVKKFNRRKLKKLSDADLVRRA